MANTSATDNAKVISVERVIKAPAERIFDLLADPRRHMEIDGSGTLRGADMDGPARLSMGARFGMAMKMGVKYRMVSTVVEFEENRRIAWAPKPEMRGKVREKQGGRIYRYELEPMADGSTLVRETWDATKEKMWFLLRLLGTVKKVRAALTETLVRLDAAVTAV